MPPVNETIYKALVESTFSHGKKKTMRGDTALWEYFQKNFCVRPARNTVKLWVMDHAVHTGKAAQAPAAALRTHPPYVLSGKQRRSQ